MRGKKGEPEAGCCAELIGNTVLLQIFNHLLAVLYTLQQSVTLIITIMMVSSTDVLLTLSRTPYMTKWQFSR